MDSRLIRSMGLLTFTALAMSEQDILKELIPSRKEKRKRVKSPPTKKEIVARAKGKRAKKSRRKNRKQNG